MDKNGSFVEIGEYKGKPVFTIRKSETDKFPFTFGQAKAKLIIDHIEEIKKFAETGSIE